MKIHIAVLTRLAACIRAEEPDFLYPLLLADGADFRADFVDGENHGDRPFL